MSIQAKQTITRFLVSCAAVSLLLLPAAASAKDIYLANGSHPTSLYEIDLTTSEARFLLDLASDPKIFALAMCPDEDSLLTIGLESGNVARIDLTTATPVESVLGYLPEDLAVVQMACGPGGAIFFTDSPTDTLWTLDLSTCDPTLVTPCAPELMGVIESSLGAEDVNVRGADIAFNGPGQLFIVAAGPGGPTDRVFLEIDLGGGLPCPDLSCPTIHIASLSAGASVPGMTTLSDRRLVATTRNDHIYEVDPADATAIDLGTVTLVPSGETFDIENGDLASRWSACAPTLDFEMDSDGNPLVPGQIIDDEFAGLGITVTTNDPIAHPLMIFDTTEPGGDSDLGTPNTDFGGPGVGDGGAADMPGRNGLPRGQVLIVSEDGNQDEPNDYDGPSVIDFHFDPPMPLVTEVHVLDIDNEGNAGFVTAYDADGLEIQSQPLLPLGSNSFQVVPIGAFNVSRLEISVGASAGVSGIVFCTQCGANFEGDFRTISASPAGLKKLF
jgi:hypothetical protein